MSDFADRNDNIKECRGVTIFISNTTTNSGMATRVVGIGGACTITHIRGILEPTGSHVVPTYPCFPSYNNYTFRRVSCRGRGRRGGGHIRSTFSRVTRVGVRTRALLSSGGAAYCHGGTRCPMSFSERLGVNFFTPHSRHIMSYRGYVLRPPVFTSVIGVFEGFVVGGNVAICSSRGRAKLLERVCLHLTRTANRIVMYTIVGNRSLPRGGRLVRGLARVPSIGDVILGVGHSEAGMVLNGRYIAI